MGLIIENGTGIAEADSYITFLEAKETAEKYNVTFPATQSEGEKALRQGYEFLNKEELKLKGCRTFATQTGIFPRDCVVVNCRRLENNVIPRDIKLAQLYAASEISQGYEVSRVLKDKIKSKTVNATQASVSKEFIEDTQVNIVISSVTNYLSQYMKYQKPFGMPDHMMGGCGVF